MEYEASASEEGNLLYAINFYEVVHLSPDKRPPPFYMRYTWIIKTKEGK
jgi:hypothetical protein